MYIHWSTQANMLDTLVDALEGELRYESQFEYVSTAVKAKLADAIALACSEHPDVPDYEPEQGDDDVTVADLLVHAKLLTPVPPPSLADQLRAIYDGPR